MPAFGGRLNKIKPNGSHIIKHTMRKEKKKFPKKTKAEEKLILLTIEKMLGDDMELSTSHMLNIWRGLNFKITFVRFVAKL